jgi:hypothetical protein
VNAEEEEEEFHAPRFHHSSKGLNIGSSMRWKKHQIPFSS